MIRPNDSFPVFIVNNLVAAKSFYADNLGFGVAFENEWYLHLVSESGVQLGFLLPGQATQPAIFHKAHNGNGVIFSLEVDDADAAYVFAKDQSLKIVLELRSEDWGQRHFCIEDPNGIYLDIVQAITPTDDYQQGYE
ncbi:MAG: VOC family protein [Gammaproteobacteria bacterium]|jgi:catechol 2,3-dioxygenase-like lactoylglutathione lyase family enzyme